MGGLWVRESLTQGGLKPFQCRLLSKDIFCKQGKILKRKIVKNGWLFEIWRQKSHVFACNGSDLGAWWEIRSGFYFKNRCKSLTSDQLNTTLNISWPFFITFGWIQQQSNTKPTQKWWQKWPRNVQLIKGSFGQELLLKNPYFSTWTDFHHYTLLYKHNQPQIWVKNAKI